MSGTKRKIKEINGFDDIISEIRENINDTERVLALWRDREKDFNLSEEERKLAKENSEWYEKEKQIDISMLDAMMSSDIYFSDSEGWERVIPEKAKVVLVRYNCDDIIGPMKLMTAFGANHMFEYECCEFLVVISYDNGNLICDRYG